jgi:uncharacterized membrane protein YfcA
MFKRSSFVDARPNILFSDWSISPGEGNVQIEMLVVLFLLSWLAATISGAVGFGGALLLLPILTNVLGAKTAVPVLTIMQLIGNLSRVWFGRTQIAWQPVGVFLLGALPCAFLGSALFVSLPREWVTRGIGILLLAIVALRQQGRSRFMTNQAGFFAGGATTGFLSGVAGSAGPLGAALFLGLELPAVAYIASEAVTASAMHLTKIVVYQRYALVGLTELSLGVVLGGAMVLGAWTGKRIIERLPVNTFRRVVELLLVLSALQLIFFAE